MSYIPALNLYGMLSDLGDTIAAGNKAKNEEAQKLWQEANAAEVMAGKTGGELTPQPRNLTPFQRILGLGPTVEQPAVSVAVAPPVTASPQPSGGGAFDFAKIYGLYRNAGASDEEAKTLAAVNLAESSGNPRAHNTTAPDDSYGLGQINMYGRLGPERLAKFGLKSPEELYDPATNARVGLDIAHGPGGLNNWSTYKSGAYKQYLPRGAQPIQVADASGRVGIGGEVMPAPAQPLDVMRGFPKALQTLPGIASVLATQNPYMKTMAEKALATYTQALNSQTRTLTTPEERSVYGIAPEDKGIYQVDEKGKLSLINPKTAAAAQSHVVGPGAALVGPNGELLYRGTNANTSLTEDAIENAANREIAGDQSWRVGLGRGAQGAENITAVQNRAAEIMKQRGTDPQQIIRNIAKFGGEKAGARSAGQMAAKLDILGNTVSSAAGYAVNLSNQLPRSQWMPINKILQMGQRAQSDPKLAAFTAATNTLVNEYARAIGGGTGTDASREHAREMLSEAQSPDAYAAVVNVLQREVGLAHQAAHDRLNQGTGEAAPSEKGNVTKRFIYDEKGNLKSAQ